MESRACGIGIATANNETGSTIKGSFLDDKAHGFCKSNKPQIPLIISFAKVSFKTISRTGTSKKEDSGINSASQLCTKNSKC